MLTPENMERIDAFQARHGIRLRPIDAKHSVLKKSKGLLLGQHRPRPSMPKINLPPMPADDDL